MLIYPSPPDHLIIRDSPGCSWVLGGIFLPVGLAVVAGSLGLFQIGPLSSPAVRPIALLLGLLLMSAGVLVLLRSPLSTLEIDRELGRISLRQRGVSRRRREQWPLGDMEAACLSQGKDREGKPVYQMELVSRDGRRFPIPSIRTAHRRTCECAVAALNAILAGDSLTPRPGPEIDRARQRM